MLHNNPSSRRGQHVCFSRYGLEDIDGSVVCWHSDSDNGYSSSEGALDAAVMLDHVM